MKRTEVKLLGSVLDDFFQDNPLISEKLAETKLIHSWGKVLGFSVDRYTENIYVKKEILYVRLTSSVLKNELVMCREKLIQKLNLEVGREVIKGIVFI
jgi:Protein of unknown function (DUF721).